MKFTKNTFRFFYFLIILGLSQKVNGQDSKIERFEKWKAINTRLTNVKENGVILLRVKDYKNSKVYIENNYSKKTYNLYCDKIETYNNLLQKDIRGGFTFCKVLVFNSSYSKNIHKKDLESIIFLDPQNGDTVKVNNSTPHIFADIYDFKHNATANPLNLNAQKVIRILNSQLEPDLNLNLNQNAAYHPEEEGVSGCKHLYNAGASLSSKFEKKLKQSKKQIKSLERIIKEKQSEKREKLNEGIIKLKEALELAKKEKRKTKILERISELETIIEESKTLEKTLF